MTATAKPGTCEATVRWGLYEPLSTPRGCKVRPREGERLCGRHLALARRRPDVTSTEGGWCVWCSSPAVRFACSRAPNMPIALCRACAAALRVALNTVRARELEQEP